MIIPGFDNYSYEHTCGLVYSMFTNRYLKKSKGGSFALVNNSGKVKLLCLNKIQLLCGIFNRPEGNWKSHILEDPIEFSSTGLIFNRSNNHLLTPQVGSSGYLTLGRTYNLPSRLIHRNIALLFLDNPDDFPMVNHIDGNKLNNEMSNLEWCDCRYNTSAAYAHNAWNKPKRKYDSDILRQLISQGLKFEEVNLTYKISRHTFNKAKSMLT